MCTTQTCQLGNILTIGNGIDFTSEPITAIFTAGSTETAVDVPITMDSIVEPTESFNLSLIIPASERGLVAPGNITTAIAVIIDNDVVDSKCTKHAK